MGCFDYKCECRGKTCGHVGSQLNSADVIIEIPLNDNTTIHAKGHYSEYGFVTVSLTNGEQKDFYLEQFREYFDFWFEPSRKRKREDNYIATKVWTAHENTWGEDRYGNEIHGEVDRDCFYMHKVELKSELTPEVLAKCIHP